MNDAVGGIAEGHGKIGRREPPEEGKEQRDQRAFARAGSAGQQENELRLAVRHVQEVIQRRQECESQERPDGFFRRRRTFQQEPQIRKRIRISLRTKLIARELFGKLNRHGVVTGHKEMPAVVDFFPAGHLIHRLTFSLRGCLLNGVADTVLDHFADFQNTVRAPLFDQPVEGEKIIAANVNLRQSGTVMSHTAKAETLFLFGAVMDRDFAHNVGKKVA